MDAAVMLDVPCFDYASFMLDASILYNDQYYNYIPCTTDSSLPLMPQLVLNTLQELFSLSPLPLLLQSTQFHLPLPIQSLNLLPTQHLNPLSLDQLPPSIQFPFPIFHSFIEPFTRLLSCFYRLLALRRQCSHLFRTFIFI
jgi:hypothetical protein